jgi:murein DD-endopeptidase MepM/ murein hydrolase activator NlpD
MPFDGEIVAASDGHPEPTRVFPIFEAVRVMRIAAPFDAASDLRLIVGNYVMARSGDTRAVFAHLAPRSIAVRPGQLRRTGEVIGGVGHSGNSTSPHLHFQLMDGSDPLTATGIPCAFRTLELQNGSRWMVAYDVVPRGRRRLRYQPGEARSDFPDVRVVT